jgi:hypothetical protein
MRAFIGLILGLSLIGLTSCSTGKEDAGRNNRFSQSPFSTTYIDKLSLVKVSSIVVLDAKWSQEASACRDHFNVDKKVDQAFRAESRINIIEDSKDSSSSQINEVVARNKADAALGLSLVRCVERLGSSFGATEAAQVGFLLNLYNPSGKVIWTGTFSMKDQAIFDNLFTAGEKLKVGTGWVTASQIMDHGLTLAAREFENQRVGLYLN